MSWFLAKLVFRVLCGNGNHTPQFDEQLRLIQADDELHAFLKARLLGEGNDLNDIVAPATGVSWKFIDVTELFPVSHFADGAEIYSVVAEKSDAALYIKGVKKNATHLLQHSLHHFTGINAIAIGT